MSNYSLDEYQRLHHLKVQRERDLKAKADEEAEYLYMLKESIAQKAARIEEENKRREQLRLEEYRNSKEYKDTVARLEAENYRFHQLELERKERLRKYEEDARKREARKRSWWNF